MPVVVNCTKCQKKLKIPDELLGKKVKCPTCSAVFTAEASEAVAEDRPAPRPAAKKPPVEEDDDVPAPKAKRKPVDDDDDEEVSAKPSKRKVVDDDDEDEPPKKMSKRKSDDDDDDDAPKKKSKRGRDDDDDDDDDDDRPSKRRGNLKPHRGLIVLLLAIGGFVTGIFILCPIAWYLGNVDMKEINAGTMDPEGRQLTNIGKILGMVGTILSGVSVLGCCLYFVVIFVFIGSAANH